VARERNVRTIVFTSSVAIYGFAPIGTDESGKPSPFNDYGRTKLAAEAVLKTWQAEAPAERTLVIVRPTVVFGEDNRGNVYNLLRQIASGRFVMVGAGRNRKSIAYVENVAAFLERAMDFTPGVHIYNYVDKPDFEMNELVGLVNRMMGRSDSATLRLPYWVGLFAGWCFDLLAAVTRRKFAISAIRVRKFCSDSVFATSVSAAGFSPPVQLEAALRATINHEFLQAQSEREVFHSE